MSARERNIPLAIRLAIYEPQGDLRGNLAAPERVRVSFEHNGVGSLSFDVPVSSPDAELVQGDFEVGVYLSVFNYSAGVWGTWIEPRSGRFVHMSSDDDLDDLDAVMSFSCPQYASLYRGVNVYNRHPTSGGVEVPADSFDQSWSGADGRPDSIPELGPADFPTSDGWTNPGKVMDIIVKRWLHSHIGSYASWVTKARDNELFAVSIDGMAPTPWRSVPDDVGTRATWDGYTSTIESDALTVLEELTDEGWIHWYTNGRSLRLVAPTTRHLIDATSTVRVSGGAAAGDTLSRTIRRDSTERRASIQAYTERSNGQGGSRLNGANLSIRPFTTPYGPLTTVLKSDRYKIDDGSARLSIMKSDARRILRQSMQPKREISVELNPSAWSRNSNLIPMGLGSNMLPGSLISVNTARANATPVYEDLLVRGVTLGSEWDGIVSEASITVGDRLTLDVQSMQTWSARLGKMQERREQRAERAEARA